MMPIEMIDDCGFLKPHALESLFLPLLPVVGCYVAIKNNKSQSVSDRSALKWACPSEGEVRFPQLEPMIFWHRFVEEVSQV